jgi:hypothetical protein
VFGLALGLYGHSLADSGGASPGFSWKPEAKPRPVVRPAVAMPAPEAPMPPPHVERPPDPPLAPVASDAPIQPPEVPPDAPQAANPGAAPLSAAQLAELYKGMSSTAREALEQILKTKGVEALSKMSESDARQTFGGMPTNVRDEIQAKWDGLSDEQRTALKKLKPDDIKDMAASQAKEIVQASVAPLMKPVESVVTSTKEAVSKTTSVLKRSRAYVQKLLAKLTGSNPPDDQTADESAPPDKN